MFLLWLLLYLFLFFCISRFSFFHSFCKLINLLILYNHTLLIYYIIIIVVVLNAYGKLVVNMYKLFYLHAKYVFSFLFCVSFVYDPKVYNIYKYAPIVLVGCCRFFFLCFLFLFTPLNINFFFSYCFCCFYCFLYMYKY